MILQTKRLLLRQMEQSDFPALCAILQDAEVMYAYEHAFSDEEVRVWLEKQQQNYRVYGFGLWAVVEKESGQMVGQCGLTMQRVHDREVLEVGYLFRKDAWHRGFATEAARACRQYAFETLGARRVYSIIRDSNTASQQVARRNGMTAVDTIVKHYYGMQMPHIVFEVRRPVRVMDFFSGVGGLSYGFSRLPLFEVVAANEVEPEIAEAYRLNYPEVRMVNADIATLDRQTLLKLAAGPIDLVVGGPPCQSYSTLGKRRMDARANLFLEYLRVLEILKPSAFVYENVPGLLSMRGGKLFAEIRQRFAALGYDLKDALLDAADFGVPQHRSRVILVGTRGENRFVYPAPTHGDGRRPYVTLADALGDLPSLASGEQKAAYCKAPDNPFLQFVRDTDTLTEHKSPRNGAHLIRIMQALQEGQSKEDLPEEIRPKTGYNNTYAKLWWDRPSMTITRNFACPSSSRCIHPRDSRAMSIREGARLQSFPDSYRFYGSDSMRRLEIGNAVPPLLSMAVARQVANLFEAD